MPRVALNGVELYYEDSGSGVPVVFCHEFAGDYRSWDPQVRALGRSYRCITYNYRGFPPSSVPDTPEAYSEDHLIQDLRSLLEHLKLERAHVVGFSMGGSVVLNFALRKAPFHSFYHPAHPIDPGEVVQSVIFHLSCQRFDEVRAAQRVDGVDHA